MNAKHLVQLGEFVAALEKHAQRVTVDFRTDVEATTDIVSISFAIHGEALGFVLKSSYNTWNISMPALTTKGAKAGESLFDTTKHLSALAEMRVSILHKVLNEMDLKKPHDVAPESGPLMPNPAQFDVPGFDADIPY